MMNFVAPLACGRLYRLGAPSRTSIDSAQAGAQLQGTFEVDARRVKPLAIVEAMSFDALLPRIQVKLTGTSSTPELGEP